METQSISPNNKSIPRGNRTFRRAMVALSVLAAVLISSIRVRATPLDGSIGSISFSGSVQVNGENATPGQTLFSKSNITTLQQSESTIVFAHAVRMRVAERTNVSVESSADHVSAELWQGRLHCLTPGGISFDLRTADASIKVLSADSVIYDVTTTECAGTTISVEQGQLQIRAVGNERMLSAGETFSTASPAHNFNPRKRIGIWILIGTGVGVLLAAVIGKKPEQPAPSPGGCIDILSGESTCH
ncbi:MAG TPA: hypothetical protein VNF70_00795 [Pyrinomonadaceae bacterium]|nr:hypothetical protein [Pyrinomonadaceae bacterium]